MNPTSTKWNSEQIFVIWVWSNYRTDSKITDTKVVLTADANSQHNFPLNIGWHDRRISSIDLRRWILRHNATMDNALFERIKGVSWVMKVDRLESKPNTQLTKWNENKCHVQRWLQNSIVFAKWISSLPLIPPSWLMSASFHFYKFKEGKKHSL